MGERASEPAAEGEQGPAEDRDEIVGRDAQAAVEAAACVSE